MTSKSRRLNGTAIFPRQRTFYGSLTVVTPGADARHVEVPSLTECKVPGFLPEVTRGYDDSKWITCNKITTLSPVKPLAIPVLFRSDYDYYTDIKVYRG